ncbi:hypothetical protein BJX99DRAFT_257213 [Aspergillus californicus]
MSLPTNPVTKFPAEGLRHAQRFITTHNAEGKGEFIVDDGDHHRVMGPGFAVGNIIYSTAENPVDINENKDITYARENPPAVSVTNGSVVHLIDYAPGIEFPFHRSLSMDYCVIIEGKFQLTLDGGGKQVLLPGDTIVNRGVLHSLKNLEEDKAGRMLIVALDLKPFKVNGEEFGASLDDL